ncbi:MAG TPA: LacI family DNA-binding transcriptional regulator [Actinomycetota bacterium]|jgi:DNA-binding LacI/PurR family transcriptional regulator
MPHRVSIRDVAREAGVSVTTVSHALNGKGRLNTETRRRVLDVAERMGYRPNPAARSLVSGRTGLIAVMASLPSEPRVEFSTFSYYSELIAAATAAAVDRDSALIVAPPSSRGWFVWDRVALDGVIVIDPMVGDRALPVLRERGIPFVTAGRDPNGHQQDAVVASDDRASTRDVLDHLVEAGADRVALVTIPPVISYITETVAAYEAWCAERAQEPRVVTAEIPELVASPDATFAAMVSAALSGPDRPDAIFAPVELVGVAIHQALTSDGVSVPDDVMLVTTHDAGAAAAAHITTLDWDYPGMGRMAADLLLDVIEGRRLPPCEELVTCTVVPRATTSR